MRRADQRLFDDSRGWACAQVIGDVLEIAVGTGLNLPHYPDDVTLTGIDPSLPMLDAARTCAERLRRAVVLLNGSAHALPFADASFDSVMCAFGLSSVSNAGTAVGEMIRVLRLGGQLVLADHVASASRVAGSLGRGLEIRHREQCGPGLVVRLLARVPFESPDSTGGHLPGADSGSPQGA